MFASILLSLGVIIAPTPSYLVAPVPSYEAPVQAILGVESDVSWVEEELFQADMELPPTTTIAVTNEANCAYVAGPAPIYGGCTLTLEDGTHFIVISPEIVGTAGGTHVLFHEIGHTLGLDECGAELYAHQYDTVELWSYPQCQS